MGNYSLSIILIVPELKEKSDSDRMGLSREPARAYQWHHMCERFLFLSVLVISVAEKTRPGASSLRLIIPGIGDAARVSGLEKSVLRLRASFSQDAHMGFACDVFVWNASLLDDLRFGHRLMGCRLVLSRGLWTDHMLAVPRQLHESHVAVLIDDILIAPAFDAGKFMQAMAACSFDAASAAVPQWHYEALHPRPGCIAHRQAQCPKPAANGTLNRHRHRLCRRAIHRLSG